MPGNILLDVTLVICNCLCLIGTFGDHESNTAEKMVTKQGWLEFAGVKNDGLEHDGLENDGVEQEQTYILHPTKNFIVYDM